MNSEEDTFNKLRRVSYTEACVIYTMATIHLPSTTSSEELWKSAKEDLRIAGWTEEELNAEGLRRHKEIISDINNHMEKHDKSRS